MTTARSPHNPAADERAPRSSGALSFHASNLLPRRRVEQIRWIPDRRVSRHFLKALARSVGPPDRLSPSLDRPAEGRATLPLGPVPLAIFGRRRGSRQASEKLWAAAHRRTVCSGRAATGLAGIRFLSSSAPAWSRLVHDVSCSPTPPSVAAVPQQGVHTTQLTAKRGGIAAIQR